MFGISKKTLRRAALATLASVAVSLSAALVVVPLMGGHPDGPGFWLSVVCPLVIAFPASTWQFHQNEKLARTRDELSRVNAELDRVHRELLQAHDALKDRARHDGMTGALNREAFFAMLDSASDTDRPGAVLLLDADDFKSINDTYGHQTGDRALEAIADAVHSVLRPADFWGRIGGEEFAVYVDAVDETQASEFAERLRALAEAIELFDGGRRISVTLSIGGFWSGSTFKATAALTEADKRLYEAKAGGKNQVVFSSPQSRIAEQRQDSAAA